LRAARAACIVSGMWIVALAVLVGFVALCVVVNAGFNHVARAIAIHARAVTQRDE
jgi:hypothetical protein